MCLFFMRFQTAKKRTLGAPESRSRIAKEYTRGCRGESEGDVTVWFFQVSNLSRYKRRIIYDLCCISDSLRFYNGLVSYAPGFSDRRASRRGREGTLYPRKKGSRKPHSLSTDFHRCFKEESRARPVRGTFVLGHEKGTVPFSYRSFFLSRDFPRAIT